MRIKLLVTISILICLCTACGSEDNKQTATSDIDRVTEITVNASDEDTQPYWNNQKHSIAKLGEGYVFLEPVSLGSLSGDLITYINPATKEKTVVCPNAECKHDSMDCYGAAQYIPAAGEGISDKIWSYKGNIYYILYSSTAKLVEVKPDGSGHKELFDLGPLSPDGFISYALAFYNDEVYYYDTAGNHTGSKGETSTETIRKRPLSGGEEEIIFSYTGKKIMIENAKGFGDKLFFVVCEAKTEDGYDWLGQGLYAYDYKTKQTAKIDAGDVYDYYVDVENNQLYYFVTHDGLYKKTINSKDAELIYKADDTTQICNFGIVGDKIVLTNYRWALMGYSIPSRFMVLNSDGSLYREKEKISDVYLGDSGVFYHDTYSYDDSALCFWELEKEEPVVYEDLFIF